MTTLASKPTTRETFALVRDKGLRRVIVTVHGNLLYLRAKGNRKRECLDIGSLFYQAVRQRVASERAERAAAKKAKTKARSKR